MSVKRLILAKYKIVIASKRDDYLKMVDNHEVVDFILKHKLNDNWALWYLRTYKKDPKVFSKENQDKIAHFSGMTHLGNVAKVRFEKDTSFDDGLKLLEESEKKTTGVKKLAPVPGSSLSQHKDGKKFIDLGGGWAWWDLGDGASDEEAEAMNHCGNKPSHVTGDNIISLRKEVTPTHQEVLLTVIEHDGWIGEFKGKENYKPATKYHDACLKLLLDKRIKGLVGGGYLPESNLQKEDLSKEDVEKIEKVKPDFFHPYIEKLPENKFELDEYQHSKDVRSKNKLPLNATKEQIERALNDEDRDVRLAAIRHSNATKEQIERALNDKNKYMRIAAIRNPNATKEQIERALNDDDVRSAAISHPKATKEQIERALNDKNEDVRIAAIRHPNATKEQIERALNDENEVVNIAAIRHPNATKEHIDTALNDKNKYVRSTSIWHSKATKEQIERALNDDEDDVRSAAISHPNATKDHIEKALNDKNKYIRSAAISHPNATKEQIERALNDDDVRLAAIRHPKATKEQIERALNDKNEDVRRAAISHPNITLEHGKEIYKKTGLMSKTLLKSLTTKELISVMNRPTEENKDEKLMANAELAAEVLKERRKEDYEKRLPSMSDEEVNKYYQSVDEDVSAKAKDEWVRRTNKK